MNKENVQKQLDETLAQITRTGVLPRLLLHSCCGPCSSYVLAYLTQFFEICVFFSNGNIWPEAEFAHRLETQAALLRDMPFAHRVTLLPDPYDHAAFLAAAQGLEREPEGGARCEQCFRHRMERAARAAKEGGFAYFTTTLSVSPHKNAALLNQIGRELAARYDVPYLVADFKKREGYKQSVTLAKAYGLYRQDYCGCEFSMNADGNGD